MCSSLPHPTYTMSISITRLLANVRGSGQNLLLHSHDNNTLLQLQLHASRHVLMLTMTRFTHQQTLLPLLLSLSAWYLYTNTANNAPLHSHTHAIINNSILGMNLFGCKFCYKVQDEVIQCDRKNFDSLLWALVTVFQVTRHHFLSFSHHFRKISYSNISICESV